MTCAFTAIDPYHPRSDPLGTKAGLAFCLPARAARPESRNVYKNASNYAALREYMYLHQPKNIPNPLSLWSQIRLAAQAPQTAVLPDGGIACGRSFPLMNSRLVHRQAPHVMVFLGSRGCILWSTGSKGQTIQIPSAGWACLLWAVVSLSRWAECLLIQWSNTEVDNQNSRLHYSSHSWSKTPFWCG